ncbi:hypothetical protein NPIL_555631 [Nephila pilipes]|uniref:Uncharacterized protein n=1 Tax=Nephila pilipes TaxID=299642 RepID=A0A8X6NXX8_NEPPI|nr:hypothetical protein NPIL_663351 [Nephila pilipes]GFT36764.1 hypothetical protein NPIL_555631 [Nephila pilipes]
MPKSYSDSLDHKEIKNQLEENGSDIDVPQSETEILSNKLDNELEHLAAFMPSGIEMTKKFQEEDPETWNCHESD